MIWPPSFLFHCMVDRPAVEHAMYGRNLKFINYRESYEINVNLSDGYLSKRMQYINRVIKHFWNRWRKD